MSYDADLCFAEGLEAYESDDLPLAEGKLKMGLVIQPKHFTARFYLAMTLMAQGRIAEARQEFTFIKDYAPDFDLRRKAIVALGIHAGSIKPATEVGVVA